MRKKLSTIILVFLLLLGLSLLLYPAVSNYVNTMLQSGAISTYTEAASNLDDDERQSILDAAVAYNETLAKKSTSFDLSDEETAEYNAQLDIAKDGLMSYIDIPKINCTLPIYHGTSDEVLQVGVGHLAGSSLPVGGESSHCVLLAHRGLPSAKLFSALDQLEEGDTFTLYTLGETLTYEVDQIKIVEPEDISDLKIQTGNDYCTLVTCTPYGVNTHRLLVRGHRIASPEDVEELHVTADASQIEPIFAAPFAAIPIVLLMMGYLFTSNPRKCKAKSKKRIDKKGGESQ